MFHECYQIFVDMSQNTGFLFCFSSVSWVRPWPACLLNLTITSHLLITWPSDRSHSDVSYCGCFNMLCNVWVCVWVGFVMCGCFDHCAGVLVICVLVWCDFDRAWSLICGNKMPTSCNRGFYCRSYCLLNMFWAPLCPSSGAQEYYTVVAACGISCCGFQVAAAASCKLDT